MSEYSPVSGGNPEGGIRCPECGGDVVRVRRRVFDRVVSLFSPRYRFRCMAIGCGWEGTLRAKWEGGLRVKH